MGETAKVLVKCPYPEAEAVLTVEREGVLARRRVTLKGSGDRRWRSRWARRGPQRLSSGVVLVRGRVAEAEGIETGDDPGRPEVRVGYVELKVEKKSKRLAVEVTPERTQYRPREKVKVDVAVRTRTGRARPRRR